MDGDRTTTSLYRFLPPITTFHMMRQLHAVYGEWLLKDGCWNFVVDHFKGARMLFLSEGSTHADLVAMTQEDYSLDMNT
ncbi:hypothetical protein F2Q70_00024978 [Brassica cretica]|uniref:Uncharacterized protein n=1 Tax=Brassica cretica TaxID=69181 RepID=A0A8S9L4J6_BRACR|nr:hypothetical protein F2Q70_00024978 [Brassica cretica]